MRQYLSVHMRHTASKLLNQTQLVMHQQHQAQLQHATWDGAAATPCQLSMAVHVHAILLESRARSLDEFGSLQYVQAVLAK